MLGKTNGFIISFIMLLYTCGSCISYFVIIGSFARSSSPAGDLFLDVFQFLLPKRPAAPEPRRGGGRHLPAVRVPAVHDEECT